MTYTEFRIGCYLESGQSWPCSSQLKVWNFKIQSIIIIPKHTTTHLSLYHTATVVPHGPHKPKYIYAVLCSYLLELCGESNESPCPPHTSTAMNHNRTSVGWIWRHHFTYKVKKRCWVIWYTVVWPHSEMVLRDDPFLFRTFSLEGESPYGVVSQRQDLLYVNTDVSVHVSPIVRPVLVTLDLYV